MKEGEAYPAIAVSGPFGAVKEQCSGLYANELATQGFITMAFDLYFGKTAFAMLKGDNRQFIEVPDANHTDLYDGGPEHNKIPWTEINSFFKKNLK